MHGVFCVSLMHNAFIKEQNTKLLFVIEGEFLKRYFRFREMNFFVRPLKYANFHPEYYPSCVTSCNEFTYTPVFLSA